MANDNFEEKELDNISEWILGSKIFYNKAGYNWVKLGIQRALRYKTDSFKIERASVAARKILKTQGLIGLTRTQGRSKKIKTGKLVFEHIVPLNSLVERCMKAKNIKAIKKVLSEMEVVWITKSEDKKLNKNHKNKNGRENKRKAESVYKDLKIKLEKIS